MLQRLTWANSTTIEIASAGAWDVLFLIGEIGSGVAQGHFSAEQDKPLARLRLAYRCARAIAGGGGGRRGSRFLAARMNGVTVGAAFVSSTANARGETAELIEFVAVDPASRGVGVGDALVRHIVENASRGTAVKCWCAPLSRVMQDLLRKLGFRMTQRAAVVAARGNSKTVWPALWVWRSRAQRHAKKSRVDDHPASYAAEYRGRGLAQRIRDG